MVESINFVCLGQTEFVNELGKKGQSSDITTYGSKVYEYWVQEE